MQWIPAVKWMARLGMRATGRSILTSRDSKLPSELRIITRPAIPKSLTEVIEVRRDMIPIKPSVPKSSTIRLSIQD